MTGAGDETPVAPGMPAMLNVDLSTLRGQELRQLLDSTRRRGDAAVSYEILQEMAARRQRGEPEPTRRLFGAKRPAEPRLIELNLGDPLDPKDPELEEAAAHPPAIEDWELEAPDDDATYLHPPAHDDYEPEPPPARPRRRWPWLGVGLTLGLLVGLAVGGWAESVSNQPATPPLQIAAATPPAAAAQPAVDPIAVETETAPETPPQGAISPATAPPAAPPAPQAAAPPPPAAEVAEDTAPVAPPPADTGKPVAKEAVVKEAAAKDTPTGASKATGACAGQPTPADRIICQTPHLQQLQKALRQAYADALDAHQDRDLLREHELAWRDARSPVTEPDKLARLYEERIRKLNAAAAEARAAR
jgi:hypothetical protein